MCDGVSVLSNELYKSMVTGLIRRGATKLVRNIKRLERKIEQYRGFPPGYLNIGHAVSDMDESEVQEEIDSGPTSIVFADKNLTKAFKMIDNLYVVYGEYVEIHYEITRLENSILIKFIYLDVLDPEHRDEFLEVYKRYFEELEKLPASNIDPDVTINIIVNCLYAESLCRGIDRVGINHRVIVISVRDNILVENLTQPFSLADLLNRNDLEVDMIFVLGSHVSNAVCAKTFYRDLLRRFEQLGLELGTELDVLPDNLSGASVTALDSLYSIFAASSSLDDTEIKWLKTRTNERVLVSDFRDNNCRSMQAGRFAVTDIINGNSVRMSLEQFYPGLDFSSRFGRTQSAVPMSEARLSLYDQACGRPWTL